MNCFSPILAQVDNADIGDAGRARLITLGAYALVTLVILGWVIFFRKQRRKRRHTHKPPNWESPDAQKTRRSLRHRHRQTDGLPRNPSRAESGGLPPRRPDDVPPRGS